MNNDRNSNGISKVSTDLAASRRSVLLGGAAICLGRHVCGIVHSDSGTGREWHDWSTKFSRHLRR
jgi:hypothetical protein